MEIITYPGSGVTKVEDIKGKKMAFTAQTSNSGFRAPSALLKQSYGLEAGKDYEPVFSGKHDNSVIGVANKDYPAAAIANEVMFRIMERGVVKKEQIVTIYKSKTFPTTGYGHVYNLKPELAAKVKEAFFTFPWDGSELQKEFASTTPPMQKFLPISYKDHWQSVRESDEAVGVKYDCKG
jgi:phosphonate transport system substrate-binding protein